MPVDAHEATWAAMRRVVTALIANVSTELTADAPAGLNVTAPSDDAYFVLPNEASVRRHVAGYEGNVTVYLFPSGERQRVNRTQGAVTKTVPSTFELNIVVRVLDEVGAATFAETWKDLQPVEREFLRCETLLGAIQDVLDGASRDGDNVLQVEFISSTSGDERFGDRGVVGSQRWRVQQIITIPVQNS